MANHYQFKKMVSVCQVSVFNVAQINTLSVSVTNLCKATLSEPVLKKAY